MFVELPPELPKKLELFIAPGLLEQGASNASDGKTDTVPSASSGDAGAGIPGEHSKTR
jgi:hypothetical protein